MEATMIASKGDGEPNCDICRGAGYIECGVGIYEICKCVNPNRVKLEVIPEPIGRKFKEQL
jgi:hypothetical protein